MAGPKKDILQGDLLENFAKRVAAEVGVAAGPVPRTVGEWASGTYAPGAKVIELDTGPFTFVKHEYLRVPYADQHPFQVEMKAAQMGNTTRAFLRKFWCALFIRIVGVLYFFPSKTGVGDFVKTRIDPLIDNNPETIGKHIINTDSVTIKRVGPTNLIYRGMKAKEGLRSDPVGMIVIDELDLVPPDAIDEAVERMSHSIFRWRHYLSNPSIPGFGIDKEFALSDQRFWMLKCPRCNKYTCMEDVCTEDTFQDVLVDWKGEVVRLCPHCRDAALDPSRGEWVAKYPSVEARRGYHYSQLYSQFVPPAEIRQAWITTTNKAAFFNYKLGKPYIEAENRLSREQILALCGSRGIEAQDPGQCYMGVDQGPGEHYVVIGKLHPMRVVYVGKVRDWEDLDLLVKNFNVSLGVVDAQPEVRNSRAFAAKHRGKVFICYYNKHQKGGYAWDERNLTVNCNRTESLDASHAPLLKASEVMPRQCGVVEEFATHAANVAKVLEEKADGSKIYIYAELGPDHFRHAYNYMCMARDRAAGSAFGGCDVT